MDEASELQTGSSRRKAAKATDRSERTRIEILAAAEEVFARQGLAGARVDDIAERAGIHRATLFYYFADKAAIHTAVLANAIGTLHERLGPVLAGGNPAEMAERAIAVYVDFVWERPWIPRLLLRETVDRPPGEASPLLAQSQAIIDEATRILVDRRGGTARPPIDPLHLIVMVSGAMNLLLSAGPTLAALPGRAERGTREQIKHDILTLVWAATGIRPSPEKSKRPRK